ncbi:LOW QUALITY PROTEIN: hypothetical protein Cgig2_018074 [Carnegiea gigantea]|uniref:Uncharacterized protein n=1 Tax=Carnegiea gigantea TaxID=171969 RepID=A0A9Q1K9S5_9CARY|nr:LOW QUALITY PROTEIN: hypothetical protein Cgig2_018074 [Carnegiea gigantea]
MATYSSVTFNGSFKLEGAKVEDLVKPSHQRILGGKVGGLEIYDPGLGVHQGLPNSPRGNLRAPSEAVCSGRSHCLGAEHSLNRWCGDGPLAPLSLEGGGSTLKTVGAEAAVMSCPPSARWRSLNLCRGSSGTLQEIVGSVDKPSLPVPRQTDALPLHGTSWSRLRLLVRWLVHSPREKAPPGESTSRACSTQDTRKSGQN